MSETKTVKTPQEIGTHALAKAVVYADRADRYARSDRDIDEFMSSRITAYSGLATVYAEIAKAAAAIASNA
ncbi:hypothetical protein GTY83_19065 [Streptomyces sp. SID4928]|uniref:hypothetical protein n=1 Tax=unclassified Streptomyces TaxID=2593676 RepID=UPI0001C1A584|nr:hypothetical protein [Streptomyces sp. ACT-1]EGE43174.1 hypothetical protein SACT1_3842 [Streptomyces sp. ACT-1]MYR51211.1 hypothetical protein [Streptomyces sp. SID4928]